MSLTRDRSILFSRLHTAVLKPHGFRKATRFCVRQFDRIHYCVERTDSRYDDGPSAATLRLEIAVFHEQVHSLLIGWPTFPGADRSAIAVYRSGLRWMLDPPEITEMLLPSTNQDEVLAQYIHAVNETVLPFFERCQTVDGLLDVVRAGRANWQRSRVEAALLHLSGKTTEARAVLEDALISLEERLRPPVRELLARIA